MQRDHTNDGVGDACWTDSDRDGSPDQIDPCPEDYNFPHLGCGI